jgi:hypothetical protein
VRDIARAVTDKPGASPAFFVFFSPSPITERQDHPCRIDSWEMPGGVAPPIAA